MRTSKKKIWKITSLILMVLIIFVGYSYFQESKKNLLYKKDLEIIKGSVEKYKKENLEIRKQVLANQDPLSQEKLRKEKFGEALEGENEIFVSPEVLDSIILPF